MDASKHRDGERQEWRQSLHIPTWRNEADSCPFSHGEGIADILERNIRTDPVVLTASSTTKPLVYWLVLELFTVAKPADRIVLLDKLQRTTWLLLPAG